MVLFGDTIDCIFLQSIGAGQHSILSSDNPVKLFVVVVFCFDERKT